MKKKFSTVVDVDLYERFKATVRREGKSISEVLELLMGNYIGTKKHNGLASRDIVEETRGTFNLPGEVVDQLIEEIDDMYEIEPD